jgi:hypothetical protein
MMVGVLDGQAAPCPRLDHLGHAAEPLTLPIEVLDPALQRRLNPIRSPA